MRFKCFKELGQTLMVYFLHNFDFSFDRFSPIWLEKFELFINFDSNFLIEQFVKAYSDDGIGSLADAFADNVKIDILNVTIFCTELVML